MGAKNTFKDKLMAFAY